MTAAITGVVRITMDDYSIYTEKIALFGSLLRKEGLQAGIREDADACSILMNIDLSDRNDVKTALRTVYAKSRDEQLRFDRIFDSFFLSEDVIRAIDEKHRRQELEKRQAMKEAEESLKNQTPGVEYSEKEKEAYSQLSDSEKKRLDEIQKRMAGRTKRSEPLYSEFIKSVFMKSILEQAMKMEDSEGGGAAIDPEIGLLFRDISEFKDNEIPKAVMYIQDLASKINGEISKKRKSGGRSSVLDFKKTIRKGLENGGCLFRLSYKKPKKKKKQLLILCDVSGSMIQFSEFALRLIQALKNASDDSRVILFSETSIEADPFHLVNMDLFRSYVRDSGIYGKGTNLGAALKKLNDEKPAAISSSTLLIILSDVKSMDMDITIREIEKAKARAGRVYCLNPIPQHRWKYSNSIMSVARSCSMLSCSTLNDLGNACRRLTT